MKKIFFYILMTLFSCVFVLPKVSAWEAHVIGVTATIQNREIPMRLGIVINEVYYDVLDDGFHGNEHDNEWIELYNNTDAPINLKDWKFRDLAGNERIIHSNEIIPAHGFAVASHDNSTWVLCHWTVPDDAIRINLGNNRAWLNNTGDALWLYDADGKEVDFVSWGGIDEYPEWDLPVGDGQSVARKVKGVDTDQPDDWEVLTNPNPGTNPHSLILVKSEPELEFFFEDGKKEVGFKVSGDKLSNYYSLSYLITYDYEGVTQAISGDVDVEGNDEIVRNGIMLGSCSSEGSCVYHTGLTIVKIEIVLSGTVDKKLSSQLDF